MYTVPASTVTQLTEIILCNDTTTAVTATFNIVPSGGTADDTNCLTQALSLPTDGLPVQLEFTEFYLEAGCTIQAKASTTNQVTYHISGKEITF